MNHRTFPALLLACSIVVPAFAQDEGPSINDPVVKAQAEARIKRQPLLVDFQAPWCYSCYYMASNVMTGQEWERAGQEMVRLELDADSALGARWMKAWNVKVLPTFVLLDTEGQELGRLLGEQTRVDFYRWLFPTATRGNTLQGLKGKVTGDNPASLLAAREVLKTHHARFDFDGGLAWYSAQPPALRAALARDEQTATWLARLELQRAAAGNETSACRQVGETVLAANLGCERPYELAKVLECTDSQTLAERGNLLRSQVELMELLFEKRVLSGARCADERSVVLQTAGLYGLLGDSTREAAVFDRAIADVRARIGGDVGKDRNQADNLRVYLERAGKLAELDALMVQLVKSWPDDYVYAYRHGKSLASRGRHAEAVEYFEMAAQNAYGINRLQNAEHRARSLIALERKVDAWKVIGEALEDNGPWFPEQAARLHQIKIELSPSSTPAS